MSECLPNMSKNMSKQRVSNQAHIPPHRTYSLHMCQECGLEIMDFHPHISMVSTCLNYCLTESPWSISELLRSPFLTLNCWLYRKGRFIGSWIRSIYIYSTHLYTYSIIQYIHYEVTHPNIQSLMEYLPWLWRIWRGESCIHMLKGKTRNIMPMITQFRQPKHLGRGKPIL